MLNFSKVGGQTAPADPSASAASGDVLRTTQPVDNKPLPFHPAAEELHPTQPGATELQPSQPGAAYLSRSQAGAAVASRTQNEANDVQ